MDKDPIHHRPELARRLAAMLSGHDPLSAAGRSGLFLSAPRRTGLWANLPGRLQRAPWSESLAMTGSWLGFERQEIYETGIGQRSISTLQDGSSVELDAGTRVKVVLSQRARNVELIYGQVIFYVAHDAQRPFVVRAADREITALGSPVQISIADPQIAGLRVNGMFRAGEPRALVDALEEYFPIAAQDYGDTRVVLTQRR